MYNFGDKFTFDQETQYKIPPPPANATTIGANSSAEFQSCGQDLARFLNDAVKGVENPRRFRSLMHFLCISKPFCDLKYQKIIELQCEKQSQGRLNDSWVMKNVKGVFKRWQTRWVILNSNNLFYYEEPEDNADHMKDSIPFDSDTIVKLEECSTKYIRLVFIVSRRTLKLEISDALAGLIALHAVAKVFSRSSYAQIQRFESFAPIRKNNDCMFFPDGEGYFFEMFHALERCKQDIMICDWWFSPEMPLIRPSKGSLVHDLNRIDRILQRAANRGVKVYVIVYKEFSMSMCNDSEHVKRSLEALSPNIKVLRHPNVIVSLWSHHEKMVIVDRKTVFMGGLDLCWGRFDYHEHPLFNDPQGSHFPGIDYYNPLKRDIVKASDYEKSMIELSYPRMPWHDVAVMLRGRVVNDFVAHFNTYWNHARETNSESEVLFMSRAKPNEGQNPEDLMKKFSITNEIGTGQPGGSKQQIVETIDAYEANPGASTETLQKILQLSTVEADQNSLFAPQVKMFNLLQEGKALEDGRYTTEFLQQLKEEADRQMRNTQEDRKISEAEKKIDQKTGAPQPEDKLNQYLGPVVNQTSESLVVVTTEAMKEPPAPQAPPAQNNYPAPPAQNDANANGQHIPLMGYSSSQVPPVIAGGPNSFGPHQGNFGPHQSQFGPHQNDQGYNQGNFGGFHPPPFFGGPGPAGMPGYQQGHNQYYPPNYQQHPEGFNQNYHYGQPPIMDPYYQQQHPNQFQNAFQQAQHMHSQLMPEPQPGQFEVQGSFGTTSEDQVPIRSIQSKKGISQQKEEKQTKSSPKKHNEDPSNLLLVANNAEDNDDTIAPAKPQTETADGQRGEREVGEGRGPVHFIKQSFDDNRPQYSGRVQVDARC